ncbi:MAG: hypothetical protein ONB46_10665 [candidate division KSB1 bacterium]|nr:hypothetical protein [candidate division KSB1 bacterium]MDZ7366267.1 hypothetical protein [candidate division KSB1 bacterium]MDZ7404485.1 hypothetical protein [candidate division KSB1 bacterium]
MVNIYNNSHASKTAQYRSPDNAQFFKKLKGGTLVWHLRLEAVKDHKNDDEGGAGKIASK